MMQRLINIKQRFRVGSKGKERPKRLQKSHPSASNGGQEATVSALCPLAQPESPAPGTGESMPMYEANDNAIDTIDPSDSLATACNKAGTHAWIPEPLAHAEQLAEAKYEQQRLDQQAFRNPKYIVSTEGEPADYTNGPARLVIADDGLKTCASLLLTLDFSQCVTRAVRAQREFAKAKRVATRELEVALHLEFDIEAEIANHEARLVHTGTDDDSTSEAAEVLRDELQTLETMLLGSKNQRQCIKARIDSKATILREIQADVNAVLEDAFVSARLMDPDRDEPDTPIEDLDLQVEYERSRREQQGYLDPAAHEAVSLDVSRPHMEMPPMTEEDCFQEELVKKHWEAEQQLRLAQIAFDRRVDDREQERRFIYEAALRGEAPFDASPEAFDLRWVQINQELTRDLMEAEAAYEQATAALTEAGIMVEDDNQGSGFVDGVADESSTDFDTEQIAIAAQAELSDWLHSVEDGVNPESSNSAEVDDWETQTVGISDSVSVVAEGQERRQIDKWREVCGL